MVLELSTLKKKTKKKLKSFQICQAKNKNKITQGKDHSLFFIDLYSYFPKGEKKKHRTFRDETIATEN
jgi:hypothetical protein